MNEEGKWVFFQDPKGSGSKNPKKKGPQENPLSNTGLGTPGDPKSGWSSPYGPFGGKIWGRGPQSGKNGKPCPHFWNKNEKPEF